MNWYSYSDENGETQYKYVEGQMSRKEMKEGGYKDCGQTMEVNGQYYSLFGAKVSLSEKGGNLAAVYKAIDNAIMLYYKPQAAMQYSWETEDNNVSTIAININIKEGFSFTYEGGVILRVMWLHARLILLPVPNLQVLYQDIKV